MKVAIGSVSHGVGDTNGVGRAAAGYAGMWKEFISYGFIIVPRLAYRKSHPTAVYIAAPPNAYAAAAEAVPFHAPGLPAAHARQTTIHPLAAALSA